MNGRSGLVLLLAGVCGLGAMYGAKKMMARDRASDEMQDIVVASRDLKVEEVLKEDMIKVIQVPKSAVPTGAFSSFQEIADRWILIKTLSDEPILAAKLAPKGMPQGLISRIPSGMRALAVEVNEQTGVSGFVLPDHRVDVIQARTDGNGPAHAETILQDVQVLAVGQLINRPEDKAVQVRTVTLAVTPEQADIVVAARSKGPLSLVLRGLNDHAVAKKAPPPSPAIPPIQVPPPPPPPAPVPPPLKEEIVAVEPEPVAPPVPQAVTIYRGLSAPERVVMGGKKKTSNEVDEDDGLEAMAERLIPLLRKTDRNRPTK
jgi:pilus assembly protein CpaB